MNLEGYTPAPVAEAELLVEDRWILSRLATVTRDVTDALAKYRYADAAGVLYSFAWDEFCSFYVEMVKSRLGDEAGRPVAQRVLAHTLDTLLRLLHPDDSLRHRGDLAIAGGSGARSAGIDTLTRAAASVMIAPWPDERRGPAGRADRGPVRPFSGGTAGGA